MSMVFPSFVIIRRRRGWCRPRQSHESTPLLRPTGSRTDWGKAHKQANPPTARILTSSLMEIYKHIWHCPAVKGVIDDFHGIPGPIFVPFSCRSFRGALVQSRGPGPSNNWRIRNQQPLGPGISETDIFPELLWRASGRRFAHSLPSSITKFVDRHERRT